MTTINPTPEHRQERRDWNVELAELFWERRTWPNARLALNQEQEQG